MRRRLWVVGLALAALAPLAAVGEETLASYGFESAQVENALFGALRGWYNAPPVPDAVRALSPEKRVAVVQTLGTFAKTFVGSPGFKKEYAKAYKSTKPRGGFGLPNLKQMASDAAEKAVLGKKEEPGALDKDPQVQLAKRLQAFLDATADVDFGAETTASGGLKRFVNEEYESKPSEWKMCYRAGKETTEALRAFASEWLAELNPQRSER